MGGSCPRDAQAQLRPPAGGRLETRHVANHSLVSGSETRMNGAFVRRPWYRNRPKRCRLGVASMPGDTDRRSTAPGRLATTPQGFWYTLMRLLSMIHSRPVRSSRPSAPTSVLIPRSISAEVGRFGSRRTATPGDAAGGKTSGFAKSRSSVTRARPSSRHTSIRRRSSAVPKPWAETVQASCPASASSRMPLMPRFSSSFSFTDGLRAEYRRTAPEPSRTRTRCRRGCRPVPGRGSPSESLPDYSHSRADQESTTPRFDGHECTACRSSGRDQSRCEPTELLE